MTIRPLLSSVTSLWPFGHRYHNKHWLWQLLHIYAPSQPCRSRFTYQQPMIFAQYCTIFQMKPFSSYFQMHLSYVQDNVHTKLQWVDPDILSPLNVNNSYALCDNIYHTVKVKRYSDRVEMNVDGGRYPVASNITGDARFNGTVYVGGTPSKERQRSYFV